MKKRETMMNMYVPSDTVREIFLYLPCKSLCRFRCVSKQCRSCINDDQFMEEHRKRNMKASHILSWEGVVSTNLQLFSMSMDTYAYIKTISTYKYNRALPSSYGMTCLHRWDNKEIALLNPSSEEIIPLPNLLDSTAYNIGFGFEPKSRRYKIVQLVSNSETIICFHIITVTRNGSCWRRIDVKPSKIRVKLFGYQPVCVDGVLYWETWNVDTGANVLVFNLSTEEMHIIKPPALWRGWPYSRRNRRSNLALLESKLCCYHMDRTTDTLLTMNIWKFDSHVGWTPWYEFEINGSIPISCSLLPLYFYDDKTILFQELSFFLHVKRVYIYDSVDKTLKIYPMAEKEGVVESFDLIVHSETMNHSLD